MFPIRVCPSQLETRESYGIWTVCESTCNIVQHRSKVDYGAIRFLVTYLQQLNLGICKSVTSILFVNPC